MSASHFGIPLPPLHRQHRVAARETEQPGQRVGIPQLETGRLAADEQQVGDVREVFRDRQFQQQQCLFVFMF